MWWSLYIGSANSIRLGNRSRLSRQDGQKRWWNWQSRLVWRHHCSRIVFGTTVIGISAGQQLSDGCWMRHFRFWRRCCWSFSDGTLCRWKSNSRRQVLFLDCLTLNMKAVWSFETPGATYLTTQCNAEGLNLQVFVILHGLSWQIPGFYLAFFTAVLFQILSNSPSLILPLALSFDILTYS